MRNVHRIWIWLFLAIAPASAVASSAFHQPMLASVYPGNAPVSEYWVSEKLDGVRGHWDGKALWSRGGYRINAPVWFTQGWPSMAMDGELWIARNRFDELSAIVRSSDASEAQWRRMKFMVFDLPGHGGSFSQRVQAMRDIPASGRAWLRPVEQARLESVEELDRMLKAVTDKGGEGLMLHHQDARYTAGRSTQLLKYKLYEDAEARVMGYTAGKGKYAGMVGALEVESKDGRRFRLGSGLSDALRAEPPPVGSWVTYRYNGLTVNGLPRFARFMRVREDFSRKRLVAN